MAKAAGYKYKAKSNIAGEQQLRQWHQTKRKSEGGMMLPEIRNNFNKA